MVIDLEWGGHLHAQLCNFCCPDCLKRIVFSVSRQPAFRRDLTMQWTSADSAFVRVNGLGSLVKVSRPWSFWYDIYWRENLWGLVTFVVCLWFLEASYLEVNVLSESCVQNGAVWKSAVTKLSCGKQWSAENCKDVGKWNCAEQYSLKKKCSDVTRCNCA